jgi:hypothetical protein
MGSRMRPTRPTTNETPAKAPCVKVVTPRPTPVTAAA